VVANQVVFLSGGERGQGRGAPRGGGAPDELGGPPPAMEESGAKPAEDDIPF